MARTKQIQHSKKPTRATKPNPPKAPPPPTPSTSSSIQDLLERRREAERLKRSGKSPRPQFVGFSMLSIYCICLGHKDKLLRVVTLYPYAVIQVKSLTMTITIIPTIILTILFMMTSHCYILTILLYQKEEEGNQNWTSCPDWSSLEGHFLGWPKKLPRTTGMT